MTSSAQAVQQAAIVNALINIGTREFIFISEFFQYSVLRLLFRSRLILFNRLIAG